MLIFPCSFPSFVRNDEVVEEGKCRIGGVDMRDENQPMRMYYPRCQTVLDLLR